MKQKQMNYHEKYDSFYQSKEWKFLRNQKWVSANGLCEMCRAKGIIRSAKEIHHIVPIEIDWSKRLEYENLIALCPQHHQEQHNRDSQLQKFIRFWDNI